MIKDNTHTSYALAARTTNGRLQNQSNIVLQNPQLINFVESISQMVIILNQNRQVLYANKVYKDFCKTLKFDPIIGKKQGEVFNCRNAFKAENGCGTSSACQSCGAMNAIFESQKGIKSTKECQILTTDNAALDLKVTASPLTIENEKLTIFSLLDISDAKRRQSFERIFMHEILNSAGAISGLSGILKEIDDPAEILDLAKDIENASLSLINEIQAQREIGVAERGELHLNLEKIGATLIIQEMQIMHAGLAQNMNKKIEVDEHSENPLLKTDSTLLKRILGNMIKNALEISVPNDKITLCCTDSIDSTTFSVHNKSVIPQNVQNQLFQRFFSTKGNGRGLGTYSMKLLGEKYLKGQVHFESSEAKGTTFFIKLPKEIVA